MKLLKQERIEKAKRKVNKKLPEGMIERFSLYFECLLHHKEEKKKVISSQELSEFSGVNPAQIRRDLIQFGSFGKKGVGYPIDLLIAEIQKILGVGKIHKIALVGVGHLGTAIAGYQSLKRYGFNISALFDNDLRKIGKKIAGLKIYHINQLKPVIKRNKIEIGIIAVPEEAAQEVADELVSAGIKVIINYSSEMVHAPSSVKVHNTNPVVDLLHTLYFLSRTS